MAEENTEKGSEGEDGAAPAKSKLSPLVLGLGLQVICMLGAAGLIAKSALFTKHADLRESVLRERAIASVHDAAEDIRTVPLQEFTVNLSPEHMLKTKLEVEVSSPATAEALSKRSSAVRARVLDVLARQNPDDANSLQGKLKIKDSIREALNDEISEGHESAGVVREVFFLDFMLR